MFYKFVFYLNKFNNLLLAKQMYTNYNQLFTLLFKFLIF